MTEMIKKRAKEIWAHQGFQRYFKNTGWMFFGQMFSLLVSFFIGAWLARYLGPENYGVFNYAIAFAGLFSFIPSLGVDIILNRDLIAYPEKRDELLGTSFILKLIGGVVAFFSAVIFSSFLENNLLKIIVVVYSLNFIFLSFNVINIYFNSRVESFRNTKILIIVAVFVSLLKIICIFLGLGIIYLAFVFLAEMVFQSIGYLYSYKKNRNDIRKWVFNKKLSINILKKSWLLMLSSAAAFIYLKIDQVMIGNILGASAVGFYSVAVKMADVWYFVPAIICSSLFPAIVNAKKISNKFYKERLKKLYFLMFLLSFVIAVIISFFSKNFINFIFGKEYYSASSVLSIYIWAGIGIFLGAAINQYLISEDKVKIIFILNLSTMIINVLLNIYLIPLIGLNGAAVATLISYLIVPFAFLFFDNVKLFRKI